MNKEERRIEREKWRAEEAAAKEEMQARLAREYGVPRDAFFDKIWQIAWSEGHACGFSEVENYFAELSDLFTLRYQANK